MGHYDYELSPEEMDRDRQWRETLRQSDRDKIINSPNFTDDEKRVLLIVLKAKHEGLFNIRMY